MELPLRVNVPPVGETGLDRGDVRGADDRNSWNPCMSSGYGRNSMPIRSVSSDGEILCKEYLEIFCEHSARETYRWSLYSPMIARNRSKYPGRSDSRVFTCPKYPRALSISASRSGSVNDSGERLEERGNVLVPKGASGDRPNASYEEQIDSSRGSNLTDGAADVDAPLGTASTSIPVSCAGVFSSPDIACKAEMDDYKHRRQPLSYTHRGLPSCVSPSVFGNALRWLKKRLLGKPVGASVGSESTCIVHEQREFEKDWD